MDRSENPVSIIMGEDAPVENPQPCGAAAPEDGADTAACGAEAAGDGADAAPCGAEAAEEDAGAAGMRVPSVPYSLPDNTPAVLMEWDEERKVNRLLIQGYPADQSREIVAMLKDILSGRNG